MDMPPSGWYPDPYGAPDLLRWWDGSTWTQHTHPGSVPAPPGATEPPTALDAIGDAPGAGGISGAGGMSGAGAAPPPTATLPAAMQPPAPWQPGAGSPPGQGGTRVLFMDESAWTSPSGPGGPGGPGRGPRRGRRLFLGGLLAGGTAAALALIALTLTNLDASHAHQAAAQTSSAPAAAQPGQGAAPSSAGTSASPTPSVTPGGVTDAQTGLSYGLAAAPWGNNGCPQILNGPQILTWSAGESAMAGTVHVSGTHPWYGEACSGPLPQGYNYGGVADLEPSDMNVVQALQQNYYSLLNGQFAQQLSQPVSVSGHPGWEIEYRVTYPNATSEGLTFTTELGEVILIDEGNGAQPAVFLVSVPANLGTGLVTSLAGSLSLANQPTGSPAA